MKLHKNFGASVMLLMLLFILGIASHPLAIFAQLQPYQDSATAKYVKTTRFDTVSVPYVTGSKTSGIVTNESASFDLKVWFAKKDSSVRDAKTFTVLKPGRSIKFSFFGKKIFRCASADSVFSQVIFGDDISILSDKTITPMDLTPYTLLSALADSLANYVLTTALAAYPTLDTLLGYANLVQDEVITGQWDFSTAGIKIKAETGPSPTPIGDPALYYYGSSGESFLGVPVAWLRIYDEAGTPYLIPVY